MTRAQRWNRTIQRASAQVTRDSDAGRAFYEASVAKAHQGFRNPKLCNGLALANKVVALADDEQFSSHPDWPEIVSIARAVIANPRRGAHLQLTVEELEPSPAEHFDHAKIDAARLDELENRSGCDEPGEGDYR